MKKIIILLSVITLTSYSLLPNSGENGSEAIEKAQRTAQESISQYTDQKVDRVRREIDNAIAPAINRADSTSANQFTVVKKSLNVKAEETKKESSGKISEIEDNITKAKATGFIGVAIGILGIALAFSAYRKRPGTDVNKVRDVIAEEINTDGYIRNEIRRIAGEQNSSYRSQTDAPSQATTDRAIEAYLASKKSKNILQQCITLATAPTQSMAENIKVGPVATARPVYQIYAKESDSIIFLGIQDIYQGGEPIYRLIISEASAYTAGVSMCTKQEEVKQRILGFDSQYLEPICSVTRSSNDPAQVLTKTAGTAECIGEEWRVTKPVTVGIK